MKKTYTVNVTCDNCEQIGTAVLEKGTPVPSIMKCPNCGCETAHKTAKINISFKRDWIGGCYPPQFTLQGEPLPPVPEPGWSSIGDRPSPSILDEQ